MNNNQRPRLGDGMLLTSTMVFVLFLYGAVPLVMTPTLGQALWTTGFSQSFANGPWYSIYAHDFGIPKPAAIAFGLAGAWPASVLIRFGLHPADAYAGMVSFWLMIAFLSAYTIGRMFGANRATAVLGGAAWMSMPVIWAHSEYSMLSLGIALLPFYFLAPLNLFLCRDISNKSIVSRISFYAVVAIIAVFMDGYTYIMFATGSSMLFIFQYISRPEIRSRLSRIALPIHVGSFALAYVLYSTYIGKTSFAPYLMTEFRTMGVDLSFIMVPTKGIHWLPDFLGMSINRSIEAYFGDSSVWRTTFSLPIILIGLVAWWRVKKYFNIATGILLIALFGFYMAFGPSLKINLTKPESLQLSHPKEKSALIPDDFSLVPTGNEWISRQLPGFNIMRAAYRWSALGIFAFWLLVVIWLGHATKESGAWKNSILFALVVLNLPNVPHKWISNVDNRIMFQQIDRDLMTELRKQVHKDEVVAFIPWKNDFMVNYVAPIIGFSTYNIGGDKNLIEAQTQWPNEMVALGETPGENFEAQKTWIAAKLLLDGTADVLVIPYFDTLHSAELWPCLEETVARLSAEKREAYSLASYFVCPSLRKGNLSPFIKQLDSLPYVEVNDGDLFATVRLRSEAASKENRLEFTKLLISKRAHYPITIRPDFEDWTFILTRGWNGVEARHVWSQKEAVLTLFVPEKCSGMSCFAILEFNVFGAGQNRPVVVSFDTVQSDGRWNEQIASTSSEVVKVAVPLTSANGSQEINISVPGATSPHALTGSSDSRVLGIALQRIALLHK